MAKASSAILWVLSARSLGEFLELLGIDRDAFEFHIDEDGKQGHFDFQEKVVQPGRLQSGVQDLVQAERNQGVLGGIIGYPVGGDLVEGKLSGSLADEFADFDGFVLQQFLGKVIHAVAGPGRVQDITGDHGIEINRRPVRSRRSGGRGCRILNSGRFFYIGDFRAGA